jgi:uncharacterized protein YecE (DUF72 family)
MSPTLPLFDLEDEPPPQAARLAPLLRGLADEGIYFGTSSWKYEGWLGSIYSPDKYNVRGKFSRKKFEAECLSEYAATFPIVGGDFSFYQFPTDAYWQRLFGESPRSLRFVFKVPEEITVATWPGHARYGVRAGEPNEHFLDPALFADAFARPLALYRDRVAALVFEFGTFPKKTFSLPADFIARLDRFLKALPEGLRYSVEIRNPEYLCPDYFAVLKARNVAHAFNAWTRMPALDEQVQLPDAHTADFTVVRALLRKGRVYEDAVKLFSPYAQLQQPDEASRNGLRRLVDRGRRQRTPTFLLVNNRLEGNAPGTIEAIAADPLGAADPFA